MLGGDGLQQNAFTPIIILAKACPTGDKLAGSSYLRRPWGSTKAKEFQYKFLQDILVNDYWLFKWKIKESGLGQICRLSTDNIKHIFWDCTCTKHFWEQFTEWWNSKFSCNKPVTLGLTTIFFGCEDMTLCQFIFTAKQYIYYRRRQAEAPEMNSWWAYLAQVKAVELAVAKKSNTVDDWKEKWEP